MILTTTPTIEGRQNADYKGVVFGEVIAGVDFVRDIAASIRNIVGGIGIDYEVLGSNNGILMVTASRTAVKLD